MKQNCCDNRLALYHLIRLLINRTPFSFLVLSLRFFDVNFTSNMMETRKFFAFPYGLKIWEFTLQNEASKKRTANV